MPRLRGSIHRADQEPRAGGGSFTISSVYPGAEPSPALKVMIVRHCTVPFTEEVVAAHPGGTLTYRTGDRPIYEYTEILHGPLPLHDILARAQIGDRIEILEHPTPGRVRMATTSVVQPTALPLDGSDP
jgi:hypothetical protein